MAQALPKIIFFAPILEYPPAGGPQISVVNAITVLSRIAELHILSTVPPDKVGSPAALEFFRQRCASLIHVPSSRLQFKNRISSALLRKARRAAGSLFAMCDVKFILDYANHHGIEIFWIDRVVEHAFAVFQSLRRRRPAAVIVGDTEAVYSRFVMRELPLVRAPLRRLWIRVFGVIKEREERELVATADAVTAVSALDADYFRSIAPDPSRIRLFSNVVDIDQYRTHVEPPVNFKHPALLLLGSYGRDTSPMDRAAIWVTKEVMPTVWLTRPDAHLYIIGRNSERLRPALASNAVTVVGSVPSIMPYLTNSTATLVPLRFESGTRFKILESGAAGIPCISTTLGAEGIRVTPNENILIADSADGFASAILKVLTEPETAKKLGRGLHELVVERYSLDEQQREGQNILKFLQQCQHVRR